MTIISVFGKPRAYESYDYFFGGEQLLPTENVHGEPQIKPIKYNEPILHYFVKDNKACLEYYIRTRGVESERDGLVYGIALTSTNDFNLLEVQNFFLKDGVWEAFANTFLDVNYRFKVPSILPLLKATKWSPDEIDRIQALTSKDPLPRPIGGKVFLVYDDKQSGDLNSIEHLIKQYTDVYVATNIDVFRHSNNAVVVKDGFICRIKDGKLQKVDPSNPDIVRSKGPKTPGIIGGHNGGDDDVSEESSFGFSNLEGPSGESKSPNTEGGYSRGSIETNGSGETREQPEGGYSGGNSSGNGNGDGDGGGTRGPQSLESGGGSRFNPPKEVWIVMAAIAAVIILILAFAYWFTNKPAEEEGGGGDTTNVITEQMDSLSDKNIVELEESPTVVLKSYDSPIYNNLNLAPEVSPNYYTVADIVYDVTPADIAKIENNQLIVVSKPSEDTSVEVIARINDVIAGTQTYTIKAKPKEVVVDNKKSQPEPLYNGRKISAYIKALIKDQNKGEHQWVVKHCDKILADPQYKSWHGQVQQIKAESEAKSKKSSLL